MIFSERLKGLRNETGLTQEEVAEKLKISRQAYGFYESDRSEPNLETLANIATFFGVSIDYLCGITDVRDNLYRDPNLAKYINDCLVIYDKYFDKHK